jgi:surfactin synthase thioesterase subunit
VLPALRADIAALETHQAARGAMLSCPVTAYGGTGDARTPPGHLEAWRETTTGAFRLRTYPGGHFYLVQQRVPLLDDIAASLAQGIARTPGRIPA